MNKVISKSDKETKKLAQDIASQLRGGEVLALVGDLGAGKTTFTQGLAEYFGVANQVSSPTFTLINEYNIKNQELRVKNQDIILNSKFIIRTLVHIDCYRLESSQELINIGIEDYFSRDDVVIIIEWAERVKDVLPKKTQWIYFEYNKKENERIIKFS